MAQKILNGVHISGTTQLDFMPDHESEGIITLGRYDSNTSRYHNIKSYVSSTEASNYLKFSLHNGTTNTVVDVLTLNGNKAATFAGTISSTSSIYPTTNGGGSLGLSSKQWAGAHLTSSSAITWANGDASILEGEVGGYSLSFNVYNGSSAMERVLLLEKSKAATFAGTLKALGGLGGYYMHAVRGNSSPGGNDPAWAILNNTTISSATYGWGWYDSNVDGSFQLWRRNNSTTANHVLTFDRGNSNATFAGKVTTTKLHDYDTIPANQNLLDIGSIKIASINDIYGNTTKTVITDYVAKHVNDNTGETTIRIYVDDNILVDGDTYMVSVYYENLIGTLSIDFADTTVTGNGTQTGTSSAPKSGRIYGYATRADYTSTYRFVDINLSQGSGHEVTLHSPKVEAGKTLTDFVATERTDMPTNSMHVKELIATSDATFAGTINAPDGSATTPAYNFTSHDGNGMYLEDYDATNNKEQVSWATDGTRRAWVNEPGLWTANNLYFAGQLRKFGEWHATSGTAGEGFKFENTADSTTPLTLTSAGNATFAGTITAAGGSADNNDTANILTLNASQHARLLVDTSSTGGHRATLALESNGNELTLGTTGSASYLDPVGELTISGQVIFPSAATTKPVLPNGFICRNDLDDTSGRHDIWGISERYYPSSSTAGDAWGIQWSGTPNDICFVGGGSDRFTVSLDEGNVTSAGTVTATHFYGDGSNLTGVTVSNADTVDSLHAASFIRSDDNDTASGVYTLTNSTTSATIQITGQAGASNYNYFLNANNDGGTKAVHFVNGSTRTADGGANAYVIRNDGGKLILGTSSQDTLFPSVVKIKNSLIDNVSVTSATTTTVVASISGSTYAAVFFDYVAYKSSNIRAGIVTACSDGSSVSFTETSTTDLGDTSDVTLSVDISGGNFRLLATTASNTWTIKSLIRAI